MNTKIYNVKHVANSILLLGKENGIPLNYAKLQGLMYLFNGFYLGIHRTAILGEKFLVAAHGPYLQNLYYECLPFGNIRIPVLYEFSPEPGEEGLLVAFRPPKTHEEYYAVLHEVWNKFSNQTPDYFTAWLKAPNGPWDKAIKAGHIYLEDDDIIEEFTQKMDAGRIESEPTCRIK